MTLSSIYLFLLLVSILRITIYIHGIYTPLIIHCCFNYITSVIKSSFTPSIVQSDVYPVDVTGKNG